MSVKFEKAFSGDFPFLAETAQLIWHEVFDSLLGKAQVNYMLDRFQSVDAFVHQTTKEGYDYYFITDETGRRGYIALCDDGSEKLFMSKLYLLPDARRNGYGKAALDFAAATAISKNKSSIYLTVNKRNARAIAVYERCGFTRVSSIVTDVGNGYVMDDFVYEKKLGAV